MNYFTIPLDTFLKVNSYIPGEYIVEYLDRGCTIILTDSKLCSLPWEYKEDITTLPGIEALDNQGNLISAYISDCKIRIPLEYLKIKENV